MQQISAVEAGRVEVVLRGAQAQLAALARLPTSGSALNEIASSLEDEFPDLADDIMQLASYESTYKDTVKALHRGTGSEEVVHAEREQLTVQYRAVLRALSANAGIAATLPAPGHTASGLNAFAAVFRGFSDVETRRLGTTRTQARDAAVELRNKQARIDNAEREVALLRDELTKQRAARAQTSAELDASLATVRAELQAVQQKAEVELKDVQATGAQRLAGLNEAHHKADSNLEATLHKLEADLKALTETHVTEESNARKKKTRTKLEAEGVMKEYDTAMLAAAERERALLAELARDAAMTEELKQYYTKVDAERERIAIAKAEDAYAEFLAVEVGGFIKKRIAKKVQKIYRKWKADKLDLERRQKKAAGGK